MENTRTIIKECMKGDKMRVLVTGYKGQLGYDVVKCLNRRDIECIGTDREEFDITNEEQTQNFIKNYCPDVVVHCSAYTAVDRAEEEQEACYRVNVEGTKNIARVCAQINAKMVYISTDYVFPGNGDTFYDIDSPTGPLGQYGKTKLLGEHEVQALLLRFFIVRISWVFGKNGNNFIKTMLRIGKNHEIVNVVDDQIGSPTYTYDLAELICDMVMTEKYGIYHATNEGICSFADLAEEIFKVVGYSTKVNHIKTSEYPAKAVRPLNSRMSKESLNRNGFKHLPEWKDALRRYLMEVKEYNLSE